ncbi:BPIB4 protein, partial [Geococcyx californianus]|nr:BPIB4 protein [Geococcyx californianus]
MAMLKLFGIIFFCGLFVPSQEVLSGVSCAVSAGAMENVLSKAMLWNGLLEHYMKGMVFPTILSDVGMLNSPTSITGLHLTKFQFPKLSVQLIPEIGIKLTVSVKLQLSGNCLIGFLPETINILMDLKITANVKCTNFESGSVQVVIEDCLCVLGAVKIKVFSGLLSASVNDMILTQLTATLPGLLCPVFHLVVNMVNIQLMGTINSVMPVGKTGMIRYQLAGPPFATSFYLGMDLNGSVKYVGGSVIPHDSSSSTLPALMDNLLILTVHQNFLSAAISLLVQISQLTLPCTPESVSAAASLGTGRQRGISMCPQFPQCSACRGTSPVTIKLSLLRNPIIILEDNKATVELSVLVQLSIQPVDGPIITLLLLKA